MLFSFLIEHISPTIKGIWCTHLFKQMEVFCLVLLEGTGIPTSFTSKFVTSNIVRGSLLISVCSALAY